MRRRFKLALTLLKLLFYFFRAWRTFGILAKENSGVMVLKCWENSCEGAVRLVWGGLRNHGQACELV